MALLGCVACGSDEALRTSEVSVTQALTHEAVMGALQRSGNWELAPRTLSIASPDQPAGDDAVDMYGSDAEAVPEARDEIWYAADGERYEALFATPDGVIYGRRGPAPRAETPNEANKWGAPLVEASDNQEESARQKSEPLYIETDSSNDRRSRVSVAGSLTNVPGRLSGAMSANGNTKSGNCSATKIGPRAVLTASHCVWNAVTGTLTQSGFWNPGQSNSSALNGSFNWSGVYLRDYTQGTQYDYAVIYLPNTQAAFNLSWMGVVWWTSGSSYANKSSKNNGYPCGPSNPCGTVAEQTCKDSALQTKQCDGWMYSDPSTLVSGDYLTNNELSFDNDMSAGHSGSAVYTPLTGGGYAVMTLVSGALFGQKAKGPRFRQSMWDDVCSWIADPNFQSSWGSHFLCN